MPHTLPNCISQRMANSVHSIARPKQPTIQRTKKNNEGTIITYTQAGGWNFVEKGSSRFKVRYFVGSSVVKAPAEV